MRFDCEHVPNQLPLPCAILRGILGCINSVFCYCFKYLGGNSGILCFTCFINTARSLLHPTHGVEWVWILSTCLINHEFYYITSCGSPKFIFIENCLIHQAKFAIHCEVSFRYVRLNMEPDSLLLINIMISLSALRLGSLINTFFVQTE